MSGKVVPKKFFMKMEGRKSPYKSLFNKKGNGSRVQQIKKQKRIRRK
jgi:hypothetical protein